MGMSLGGYTTSLIATLDRDLAFAVPIVPLASMADFARDLGRFGKGEPARLQHAGLESANFIVSPFARKSLVPPDRILIVGANADRITPIAHAERLANHFGVEPMRLVGGHLLQVGRRRAFREIGKMLDRLHFGTRPI
jgi:acetyl esterase/lipase